MTPGEQIDTPCLSGTAPAILPWDQCYQTTASAAAMPPATSTLSPRRRRYGPHEQHGRDDRSRPGQKRRPQGYKCRVGATAHLLVGVQLSFHHVQRDNFPGELRRNYGQALNGDSQIVQDILAEEAEEEDHYRGGQHRLDREALSSPAVRRRSTPGKTGVLPTGSIITTIVIKVVIRSFQSIRTGPLVILIFKIQGQTPVSAGFQLPAPYPAN